MKEKGGLFLSPIIPPARRRKEGEAMGEKFPTGHLVTTAGVNDRAASDEAFAKFVRKSLRRHEEGDWGDLSAGDTAEKRVCPGQATEAVFSIRARRPAQNLDYYRGRPVSDDSAFP